MNVLLTSAGRNNVIVEYFKDAVGPSGRVISVNSVEMVSSAFSADKFYRAPLINDPSYIPFLQEVCVKEKIDLILSLFDLDLPFLSLHRKEFEDLGICAAVSTRDVIDICYDKIRTYEYCSTAGLHVPATFTSLRDARKAIDAGLLKFPLILKPRWGTGSLMMDMIKHDTELELCHAHLTEKLKKTYIEIESLGGRRNEILIQQFITGSEFNIDIINDLQGAYRTSLSLKKFEMREGQTESAVTVNDPRLSAIGETLGTQLKHYGILDVDSILDEEGKYHILDLNPRFSGAYPFSHIAGANIPAAYIAWAEGRSPDPEWLHAAAGVRSVKGTKMFTPTIRDT